MLSSIPPITPHTLLTRLHQSYIADVIPVPASEFCACSYCGKVKRVAFYIIARNGKEAVVCHPCADRGMNWLEKNFPRNTALMVGRNCSD